MKVNLFDKATTHSHFEGGKFLCVDDSIIYGVGLRQVDHFAEREERARVGSGQLDVCCFQRCVSFPVIHDSVACTML